MNSTVLNLGCGNKPIAGAVNLDVCDSVEADVVHDLNEHPWPFGDNSFTEIHAYDVIEHLDDVVLVMEELHRVARHRAKIQITVPHFSCANAYTDPTHRHFFGIQSFSYFAKGHPLNYYSAASFNVETINLVFAPSLLNKLVWRLAKRNLAEYERRWSWIFPAWFVAVTLEVLKPE